MLSGCHGPARFNPRPRVGGDIPSPSLRGPGSRFNPRPRVGGDKEIISFGPAESVSIHAPAWGATPVCVVLGVSDLFQSTPPRGGRPNMRLQLEPWLYVSIHAPAWGATVVAAISRRSRRFQSTPPRGGRLTPGEILDGLFPFQSTPPRGGRHHALPHCPYTQRFNPRPRVGGDPTINGARHARYRFQSTPPRGGRLFYCIIVAFIGLGKSLREPSCEGGAFLRRATGRVVCSCKRAGWGFGEPAG